MISKISLNILLFICPKSCINSVARFIFLFSLILSVFGIVGYSVDLYRHGKKHHFIGWFSSGAFTILTILISVRLILKHIYHWNAPKIQSYVIRIIWMLPIYAIESWIALRFRFIAFYMETLRECYEAYVIYSFLYYLIALLGEEQQLVSILKEKPVEIGSHIFPINLFVQKWILGFDFLHKCQFGALQYVVLKCSTAILAFLLRHWELYTEGEFRMDNSYPYICLVNNLSQLWALYCLILFFLATKKELAPWAPVGKFMCVKLVVFFTWWQALVINALAASGSLRYPHWSQGEVSSGLQDYLICIEMFLASLAFTSSFSHKEYADWGKGSSLDGWGGAGTAKADFEGDGDRDQREKEGEGEGEGEGGLYEGLKELNTLWQVSEFLEEEPLLSSKSPLSPAQPSPLSPPSLPPPLGLDPFFPLEDSKKREKKKKSERRGSRREESRREEEMEEETLALLGREEEEEEEEEEVESEGEVGWDWGLDEADLAQIPPPCTPPPSPLPSKSSLTHRSFPSPSPSTLPSSSPSPSPWLTTIANFFSSRSSPPSSLPLSSPQPSSTDPSPLPSLPSPSPPPTSPPLLFYYSPKGNRGQSQGEGEGNGGEEEGGEGMEGEGMEGDMDTLNLLSLHRPPSMSSPFPSSSSFALPDIESSVQ